MTIRAVRLLKNKPVVDQGGFFTDIGMEIRCSSPDCGTAYRIDYATNEAKIDTAKLRRDATTKVNRDHPHHPDVILLKS